MKRILLIFLFIFVNDPLFSLTDPQPFQLYSGSYSFNEWSDSNPSQTYPPNMIFQQSNKIDPLLEDEMTSDWIQPYNLSSKSRINGQGKDGISFINTEDKQTNGGGYLGAAVLALDTRNCQNINVSWRARTISTASRPYSIILQYRIDTTAEFKNISGCNYQMGDTDGSDSVIGPMILPKETENQSYIQLRWKYYSLGSGSGRRAELGLDDILVKSEVTSISEKKINNGNDCFVMKSIFPNPVFENFTINCSFLKSSDISIKIINLNSTSCFDLYEGFVNSGTYSLPLSITKFQTSSGYYILQIKDYDKLYNYPILICR